MRQDHDPAHDQPAHRAHLGPHPHRRRERARTGPGDDASPHRLCDPARRALPAPPRLRQRGGRAPAPRMGQRSDRSSGQRVARARRPRSQELRPALPPRALRRRAPTRGRGPGTRRRPPCLAHGRALRGGGPRHPPAPAEPVPRAAERAQEVHRLRDPRHRGGGQARRSHRRAVQGCRPRAVRHARRGPRAALAPPFVADFVAGRTGGVRRLAVVRIEARRPGRAARDPPPPPPWTRPASSPTGTEVQDRQAVVLDDGGWSWWGGCRLEPGPRRNRGRPHREVRLQAPLGTSLRAALGEMLQHDVRWIPVVDDDERYLGVLSPNRLHAAMRRSVGGTPVESRAATGPTNEKESCAGSAWES